jgi:deoxyribodipyrimidine photo-lyase
MKGRIENLFVAGLSFVGSNPMSDFRIEIHEPKKRSMAITTIQEARLQRLNELPSAAGRYVLYWMQQSQRAECNHALEYAIQQANERELPVLVVFGLTAGYPEANLRHYRFLLEGLRETHEALARRGIRLVARLGQPPDVALELGQVAAMIICDRGYLRHQKQWRQQVASRARCAVVQVEADVVVPVGVASNMAEIGARTLRPKIHRLLDDYLIGLQPTCVARPSLRLKVAGLDLNNLDRLLDPLALDRSVAPVSSFSGGTSQARRLLADFIQHRLDRYDEKRARPETDQVSHMSKYLHFGQVSPVELALHIRDARAAGNQDGASYLEELLVRRELAHNFVHFTQNYDQYECLPAWARQTLDRHRTDPRTHLYTRQQLENAQTHDPYWNAAMREMVYTGYLHNYMRMYWGKKILEWCQSPEEAFASTLALNNKYLLDGRDPNSFANVAWVFGLHDRPWPERPIYGMVRSMSASGLERKADAHAYVQKVNERVARAQRQY